jgi:hypothetical protein
MDDNHKPTLTESQFEWAWKLVQILQPLIYDGIQSIFQEAVSICKQSDEEEKYLMTFQNFLSRIPKWNEVMIQTEVDRIVQKSGCTYLDDLITCVHIVHLKILTSIRTGKTQKKIDISIPKLGKFVHKVYINLSRELYTNVYLFETDVQPLVFQKNRASFNKMIKTAILDAVRDSIPVERLLRAYLDESTDLLKEEVKENEKKEEPKKEPEPVREPEPLRMDSLEPLRELEPIRLESLEPVRLDSLEPLHMEPPKTSKDPVLEIIEVAKEPSIRFQDKDSAITVNGVHEIIHAPKDDETLKRIAEERAAERKAQDGDSISISSENLNIDLPIEVLV